MRRVLVVLGALVIVGIVLWLVLVRGVRSSPATATATGSRGSASASERRDGPTAARTAPVRTGGRRLSGRVLFQSAPILATVWIVGDRRTSVVSRETAPDGTFSFVDLPAERYTLAAFTPKHAGRTAEVDLRTGNRDGVTLRLQACDRELAGRVVDNTGGVIAGARIEGGGAATLAGGDGRFRLCTANARLEVVARAEGYAAEQRSLAAGDSDVVFELRPEVVVGGRVTLDGAPVPNALVVAAPDGDRTWDDSVIGNTTVTSDDGTFELRGIGAGDYIISSRAEGARTAKGPHLHLALGANPSIELALVRTIDVTGHARVGTQPAANVGVQWNGDNGTGAYAVTDATGVFTLTAVVPSTGEVMVPGRTITNGAKREAGKDSFDLELTEGTEGTIRGRVVSHSVPIPDARVISREQSFSGDHDPRSQDDGTFELTIRGGTVHVAAESDELGMASEDVTVEVKPGKVSEGVVLELTRGASVAGTIVDETGAPIEGAAVQLVEPNEHREPVSRNRERGQGVANAKGEFRVTMLVPQTYAIRAVVGGREVALVQGAVAKVAITSPGEAVTGVRVAVIARQATIAGRVVDERGEPVADASIQVAGAYRRADVDGRFSIRVLARGTYQVTARGRPGSEATVSDISPGTTDLVITLPAPGSIRVACPLGVTAVRVYPASGSVMGAPCDAVIDRMPVGHVLVMEEADDRQTSTALGQGDVISGKETMIRLAEVGTRDVEIRVTGAGKPIEKVGCFIDQARGSLISSNRMFLTNKDGIAKASAYAVPSRMQCVPPRGWTSKMQTLDATTTRIAVELERVPE